MKGKIMLVMIERRREEYYVFIMIHKRENIIAYYGRNKEEFYVFMIIKEYYVWVMIKIRK